MQVDILNLDGKSVGKVELSDSIFGIDPRADILHRVVTWQRANARAGTHAVKTVSDVAGSGKKAFKQKKTGNARQGERYNVHMRGGGVVHGPVVRDHAIDLPKKIRALGLKMALIRLRYEKWLPQFLSTSDNGQIPMHPAIPVKHPNA